MTSLDAFRKDTRKWLDKHCPKSMRTPMPEDETVWGGRGETYKNPEAKTWLDNMASRGWTTPRWPSAYGGGGLDGPQARVLSEELKRINARPALSSFGIWMLGPALLEFASEEQKQTFLPPIVRGEIRWCQGYSEPGHGSDLAALQTKAVDEGDHYLVNGAKIWTSYADHADWIFCLVRTDPEVPKHEGISFLLFDMASEGVSTSPIQLISGASPFCQTFFDNVRVPKGQLVGELNKGWTIAKRLLQHERQMISGIGGTSIGGASKPLAARAKDFAGVDGGRIADDALRAAVTHHQLNDRAFALTLARGAQEAASGNANPHLASMFKYYGSEQNKRKFELLLDTMGSQSLGWAGDAFAADELGVTRSWLRSKANSIEGGTSEVQLNVIAKRVLGLPD
ncbi:MAG: acyl-CoA dehydrogenase family protein [Pseudomonadota bacterium]